MADINQLGEVISADLLVIGGGVGGLAAAIKAKEEYPDVNVLIVEKQTTGWAGKATKIGGFLAFLAPGGDPDKFVDFQVNTAGIYINDQDALDKYVRSTYPSIEQMAEWGANVARTPDGKILVIPNSFAPEYSMTFVDIDLMQPMRSRANKLGVKFQNKTHIVDLLKQNGKIVGAVGFDIVTGNYYIFKAKATLVANGSCGYKIRRFWMAGTGDGIAAAYRAGAEMRNAEYGNLYGHVVMKDLDGGMAGNMFMVNTQGENLANKYMPDMGPSGLFLPVKLGVGLETEVNEGRGPIRFQPPPPPPGGAPGGGHGGGRGGGGGFGPGLPKLTAWNQKMQGKADKYGPQPPNQEIAVPLHGELSCIRVDHDMKTSLEGLWAIGDTSYAGSAIAGAVASPPGVTPGSGIMFAVVSGIWAGPDAARYASSASEPELNPDEINLRKQQIFAPMSTGKGYSPWDAIGKLQDAVAPMKYSLRRSKERLNEALAIVFSVKERLNELNANDYHYLSKCHEVISMTTCAEMTFAAALAREESRGFHYREDFPEQDDDNWLKWVVLKQVEGKLNVSIEPIPIETYRIKPFK
ncbi:MAG: FAD-binding protein [Dehalococcoidales bacterium]|nr:FAD-binding protein [Dehalococcoidales bacterium]